MSGTFNGNELLGLIHILSPYQNNFSTVQLYFRKVFLELRAREALGNSTLEDCVGTLSSCQVMEYDLIIFSAGRGPMSKCPIGPYFLLDSLRELYLIATRARLKLIIYASMKCLQASCPNCESIINYFGGTQNSEVYNDVNDLACLYYICDFLFQCELYVLLYALVAPCNTCLS